MEGENGGIKNYTKKKRLINEIEWSKWNVYLFLEVLPGYLYQKCLEKNPKLNMYHLTEP